MAKRKGRQKPTQSVTKRHASSYGEEAVALYNKTGRKAQRWQAIQCDYILGRNKKDLWVHTKYGLAVPRRNGKNEVIVMRELWGLQNGEHILHTAHLATTAHSAWERLKDLAVAAELPVESTSKAIGRETIRVLGGGRIEFRTRTSKGGLGEGYDLLVIDEAQEYTTDQESALKYVVSSSKNPQTIMTGTPPTPISSGTVFRNYRATCLRGDVHNGGWAEWSVEEEVDPYDKTNWYLTNPSLGTILTERIIEDEIGEDNIDFNVQRLGLWISYNQKSEISKVDWDAVKLERAPKTKGKLYIGVKFSRDGYSVALSVAVKTEDDRIFMETIDCRKARDGVSWIMDFLTAINQSRVGKVVVDGASGQGILSQEMKETGLRNPLLPTVREVIKAYSSFEIALYDKGICHMGQKGLRESATNVEKRMIGSSGGFGYKSTNIDIDVTPLDSAILAFWACSEAKEDKKQHIRY